MDYSAKSELVSIIKKKAVKTKLITDDIDDLVNENANYDEDNISPKTVLLKNLKNSISPLSYGSDVRTYSPAPEMNHTINSPIDFDSLSISTQDEKKPHYLLSLISQFFDILCGFNTKSVTRNETSNSSVKSKHIKQIINLLQIFKTFILVTFGLMCIVAFSVYEEKEQIWTQTVISNLTQNKIKCSSTETKSMKILKLVLNGPFLVEDKNEVNMKYINIDVYGKKAGTNQSIFQQNWRLFVKSADSIKKTQEFSENSKFPSVFKLTEAFTFNDLEFDVSTDIKEHISFNFDCQKLNNYYESAIWLAACLLIFVYVLIVFELCHRTLAAALGALGGIALISFIDMERPSMNTIVTWVEWETILLIFGMMIIVAIFCETGFFDLISVRIFYYAGSRVWIMIGSLCLLSAVLSAFLDNVTTILLLTPITIRLCDVSKLEPRYIIIALVMFSNIGGTSTGFFMYYLIEHFFGIDELMIQ